MWSCKPFQPRALGAPLKGIQGPMRHLLGYVGSILGFEFI